jgi:hypothetical protein
MAYLRKVDVEVPIVACDGAPGIDAHADARTRVDNLPDLPDREAGDRDPEQQGGCACTSAGADLDPRAVCDVISCCALHPLARVIGVPPRASRRIGPFAATLFVPKHPCRVRRPHQLATSIGSPTTAGR